jgi:hypothetical protein
MTRQLSRSQPLRPPGLTRAPILTAAHIIHRRRNGTPSSRMARRKIPSASASRSWPAGTAVSVDISDWDTPGLNGKPARACTRHEIRDEVWDQLKRSLNVQGADVLEDEDLVHWFLDLDVDPLLKTNAEPLFVNLVDTWRLRPRAVTAIPNLFLAADYVQTATDLATMEAANEAARRAVNGILEHSGSDAPPCRLWNLHEPELLEPWRANDRTRYGKACPGTTPWSGSGCRRWRRSTAGPPRSKGRSSTRSARRCTSRTCSRT